MFYILNLFNKNTFLYKKINKMNIKRIKKRKPQLFLEINTN